MLVDLNGGRHSMEQYFIPPSQFPNSKVSSNHTYQDTQIQTAENILWCYNEFGFPTLELEKSEEEILKEKLK
jgi:hypothetical protein